MSTKVHYEVHILEGSRWSFLSRYPGNEREEAMSDARQAEIRTGRPTKVIRDTFYNELNYSEETVAYMSPNAKGKEARAPGPSYRTQNKPEIRYRPKRAYSHTIRQRQQRHARSAAAASTAPTTDSSFFVRLILVLVASISIAAALTATLGFLLNALQSFGVSLPDHINAQVAIYWYIAMFLLSAVALNKAFVPWRHLFRKVKANRQLKKAASAKGTKDKTVLALKPKKLDPFEDAKRQQERLEVKMLRGDLDVTPDAYEAADVEADETPAGVVPFGESSEQPHPPTVEATGESQSEPPAQTEAEAAVEPPAATEAAEISTDGTDHPADTDSESGQTPLTEMETERLYMVRFLSDTVMTLRSSQDQLGTDLRFGVNLYLAGAASVLADRHGLTPDTEQSILDEALRLIGNSEEARSSFFDRFGDYMTDKKNEDVIHAGEAAMIQYLSDTDRPSSGLPSVLKQWNKPAPAVPDVRSVFLLTYANPPRDLGMSEDESIIRHNRMVRVAIAEQVGEEVRHTGKGIFAKFATADDAICAAIVMQKERDRLKKLGSPPPPLRIALVASLEKDSDPEISGSVFSFADSLCRRLRDGEIACDERVRQTCTIPDVAFDRSIPAAHSGIEERGRAVSILWEPVPA